MAPDLSSLVQRYRNGTHDTDRTNLRSHLPRQLGHTQDAYTRLHPVNQVRCLESTALTYQAWPTILASVRGPRPAGDPGGPSSPPCELRRFHLVSGDE